MCDVALIDGGVMPSMHSFSAGVDLPKSRFLFYHYFLRAAMGDEKWKSAIMDDDVGRRFTNSQTEALAMVLLENHCESWTLDYKVKKCTGDSVLKTEYEIPARDNRDVSVVDIILPDVEFDLSMDDVTKIVLRKDDPAFKRVKSERIARQKEVHKEAKKDCQIKQDDVAKIQSIPNVKERKKALEKRSSTLRVYTGPGQPNQQQCRGWNDKVHVKMLELVQKIENEAKEEKSAHRRFEAAYRAVARPLLEKARKESAPLFSVNLELLYGCQVVLPL